MFVSWRVFFGLWYCFGRNDWIGKLCVPLGGCVVLDVWNGGFKSIVLYLRVEE